jgi:serine/threonine protein kinase
MAQTEKADGRTSSTDNKTPWSWKRLFGKDDSSSNATPPLPPQDPAQRPSGLARRLSKKVIPGLPRAGTFKRQQSELRDRLEPVKPNQDERRTVSVDRRTKSGRTSSTAIVASARLSAPELFEPTQTIDSVIEDSTLPKENAEEEVVKEEYVEVEKELSVAETRSISDTEAFDDEQILAELESRWILNLSMHFRDKSKREKFFVTYAETPTHWKRVTISLDYRDAPEGSLEEELQRTRFQRDKSARIYEAIRESLPDIQFYDTVTNLKLQTENDRLHVHVVEDLSEIISYPPVKAIKHLNCRRVREDELVFESHLSGFVYKVRVGGQVFIKKEIPGPDTVDEFLYEINALHQLSGSRSVIQFGGVVLDNKGEVVKGLLISFAEQGALIDVIYDGEGQIPWSRRERWARQIVEGLSEIHEAGFVQGDFTLSNIVIDADDNAKIIDINRRGCPVGWEPPEVAALIESNQRISMYIGVKSDLYQLGMVLYALATQQDEPENHRPLNLGTFPLEIPDYFFDLCHRCLNVNPRFRSQASALLALFPPMEDHYRINEIGRPIVVDARHINDLALPNRHGFDPVNIMGYPNVTYLEKPIDVYDYAVTDTSEEPDYPRRGRSPPSSYRRQKLPFEIPLPPSLSSSDSLDSPTTPVAQELTPVASRVGHGEKDVAEGIGSVREPSRERDAADWGLWKNETLDDQTELPLYTQSSLLEHEGKDTFIQIPSADNPIKDLSGNDQSTFKDKLQGEGNVVVEAILKTESPGAHPELVEQPLLQSSPDVLKANYGTEEITSNHEPLYNHTQAPVEYKEIQDITHQHNMDTQTISASAESRDTVAALAKLTGYPELAFVGTHISIPSTSDLALTPGSDFDDLTTDTHNDRIVLDSSAAG